MRSSFYNLVFWIILFLPILGCSQESNKKKPRDSNKNMNIDMKNVELITLGAGCFWCVEAIFQDIKGIEKVVSGYSGGHVTEPSYEEVCRGTTGHAEVIQLYYHPNQIDLKDIIDVFFATHDPTTLNRQGADVGTQYRSAIFYHNETQKKIVEELLNDLQKSAVYSSPIVTEITAFTNFYSAEDYHQDYFNLNGTKNPYCASVIAPKVAKFRKKYAKILKD